MIRVLVNGQLHEVPSTATVQAVVALLGLEGKRIAVERNGEIVPRSRHGDARLADGDTLEIVVAVGGG